MWFIDNSNFSRPKFKLQTIDQKIVFKIFLDDFCGFTD